MPPGRRAASNSSWSDRTRPPRACVANLPPHAAQILPIPGPAQRPARASARGPRSSNANFPSGPSGCSRTWSAPAARCWRTRSAMTAGPCGMIASIRRSLPDRWCPVAEAEPAQVGDVVGQLQVALGVGAGGGPRGRAVLGQDHGLLGDQQLVRAEDLARERGVLDRAEVRVGPVGLVPGQLEHPRAEGGQDPDRPFAGGLGSAGRSRRSARTGGPSRPGSVPSRCRGGRRTGRAFPPPGRG